MARRRGLPNSRQTGQEQPQPRRWRWLRRLFAWGAALALLGVLILGITVAMAARSLPGYTALMKSEAGQTIVVRANDGTEIVTLGTSPGEWLPADEIPQVMKDAMVSVEDRRFYSHFGIDPIGLGRALWVAATGDRRIWSKAPTQARPNAARLAASADRRRRR